MITYLILQNPGHNRVYYNASGKMALAELKLACNKLSVACLNTDIVELHGVRYLSVEVDSDLSESDVQILSKLSFVFALYKRENENCLQPIQKEAYEYVDDKISSLLKYQGKTNELFTKMMLNVALLTSDFSYTDKIELLDPVSGKGTTLYEAALYGFNAYGIEIEQKSVHEATVFFKKFLEEEKYKHAQQKRQLYSEGKNKVVYINEFEFAKTKQEFKNSDEIKRLGFVCGSSQEAFKYFKSKRFNIIVGDLPYGIVHGNTSGKASSSATRNPSELLEQCAQAWYKTLKPGGAMVLAWNAFVASKKKLTDILEQAGFDVLNEPLYHEFEHMVDKSIKRDIIVAKKT